MAATYLRVELGEPTPELGDGLLARRQRRVGLVALVLPDGDVLLHLAGDRLDEGASDLRRLLVVGVLDGEEEREVGGLVVDRRAATDQGRVQETSVTRDSEAWAAAEDVDAGVDRSSRRRELLGRQHDSVVTVELDLLGDAD